MQKRIELIAQPRGGRFRSDMVMIDLDVLSPPARAMAEQVLTTDRRDDFSRLVCETRASWADLVRRQRGASEKTERYISEIREVYGDRSVDSGQTFIFQWPSRICREGEPVETGVEYFERCAVMLNDNAILLPPRAER